MAFTYIHNYSHHIHHSHGFLKYNQGIPGHEIPLTTAAILGSPPPARTFAGTPGISPVTWPQHLIIGKSQQEHPTNCTTHEKPVSHGFPTYNGWVFFHGFPTGFPTGISESSGWSSSSRRWGAWGSDRN